MRIYTKSNCPLCAILMRALPDVEQYDIDTVVGMSEAAFDEVIDDTMSMPILVISDDERYYGQAAIDYVRGGDDDE